MTELTQDEISALMTGSGRQAQILADLYSYLKTADVYEGTTHQLAGTLNSQYGRNYLGIEVRLVIALVRSRDFIEANHWTIPYVGSGNHSPEYRIVDLSGPASPTRQGVSERSKDMLNLTDRFLCQGEVLVAQTDGRTGVGKLARYMVNQARAMRDNVELLVDQFDGASV